MNISEIVEIRNELQHAKSVLDWFENGGQKYSTKAIRNKLIHGYKAKIEFWQGELKATQLSFTKIRV